MTNPRNSANIIVAAATIMIVYSLLLPHWMERLNPLTGDAPFYVMTAISLVEDGDFEESNNYRPVAGNPGMVRFAEELYPERSTTEDWCGWPSYPEVVQPHRAQTDRDGLYSKHGLGLPILIAAPYALAGRLGVELLLIVIAGLLTAQMVWLAMRAGASPWAAAIIAVALAVSMPIGPYALLIFPEVPAALLLIYAVRRLAEPDNQLWQWILTGVAIGYLPWLHQRFAPIALFLALYALVRLLRSRPRGPMLGCLLPIAAGGVSLLAYNYWLYQSPIQNTADHAGFSGVSGTINGAFGLLLDAQWGLLVAAPVMLLAIAALPTWIERDRQTALIALGACLPYLLVVAAYRVWWGEWGPPARYLVPVVPFAAATIGAWVAAKPVKRLIVAGSLWLPGMLLTAIGFADPQRFYHHPDGVNKLVGRLDDILVTNFDRLLVSFQPYATDPLAERFWISIALIFALITVGWVMNRPLLSSGTRRPFRDRTIRL